MLLILYQTACLLYSKRYNIEVYLVYRADRGLNVLNLSHRLVILSSRVYTSFVMAIYTDRGTLPEMVVYIEPRLSATW